MIRLAADDILKVSESTVSKSKTIPLTVDDTETLLNGLKLLFESSECDEQVRLLTLAPSNWGRVQIEKFFGCNQWQARQGIELRNSFGVLAKRCDFGGNYPMDPQLIEDIKAFYQDDAISRQTSNKKEVIHINRQPVPIRRMLMTVGQAYTIFMDQLKKKNSSDSVGKSTFYSLRPKWVKIVTPHDVCVCIYHENFDLLIQVHIPIDAAAISSIFIH